MSKIDQLVKTIVKAIDEKDRKKTRALDTVATVSRVDGDTAWVTFAGSDQETPVKQTISVKKGDKIHVRASKGKAWIVGNETAPPTDDTLAKEALKRSDTATRTAKRASDLSIIADVMYYLASDQEEGVTVEDEGWTKEPQEVTESLPYLWAYHDYERGNGKHFKSEPIIMAMYAEDGKGIDTLTTYYALGTSTSTAPTSGWATTFSFRSGYYIWRKELISLTDGTTTWSEPVYDGGLTEACELAFDAAQYIWTQPSASATTNVPSGQYVTEVDKVSYRSNPTGGALLLRSAGLYLRYAAQNLVELVSAGLKIYEPTDTTYPTAQFLSSGAIIGKEGGKHISIDSNGITLHGGSNSVYGKFASDESIIYGGTGYNIRVYTNGMQLRYGTSILGYILWQNETSNQHLVFRVRSGSSTAGLDLSTSKLVSDVPITTDKITAGNIAVGSVSITPTADTPTSQSVSFGKTFSSAPQVVVTPESSVAGTTLKGWAVTNITTTGFTAWVTRGNTTSTTLHWIAIG